MATSDYTSIVLTQGQTAIIDNCDADLQQFKWQARKGRNNCYYATRTLYPSKSHIAMHRVIMGRIQNREIVSDEWVDHIDGNPLNNRRSNLRIATPRQNALNSRKRIDNTSGYKGVTYRKDNNKWRARICKNGKRITLGYADTAEDAFKLYQAAAQQEYGEYIRWE